MHAALFLTKAHHLLRGRGAPRWCTWRSLARSSSRNGRRAVPCRYGLLGATGITALGLLKLNVFGPGFTDSVRSLWKYEKKPPPLPKGKAKAKDDK